MVCPSAFGDIGRRDVVISFSWQRVVELVLALEKAF
jgi:hypothetical protein